MPAPKSVVGSNIRRVRKAQGLTQEAAAERCGVHLVEFSRAERGVRDLRVSTLDRIAAGLRVPAGELVAGLGGKQRARKKGG